MHSIIVDTRRACLYTCRVNSAYLLAGLGSLCYGAGDFFGGIAARRGPLATISLLSGFGALAVLAVGLPMTPGVIRAHDLAWAAAGGLFSGIGLMLIYHALAIGPVSVASPVLAIVGLALPAIVGITLGERPALLAIVGLLLAPLSIVLLAQSGAGLTDEERARVRRVLWPALGAGLAAGCFLTCFGRIQAGAGLWPIALGRGLGMVVLAIAMMLRREAPIPPRSSWAPALAAGALDSLANVAYVAAVPEGSLALVAAIVSLAPATTVLLARAVLHERMSGPQRIGFAVALASGALISLG
jgi:drug/metabolite transporter (DMT)-like permease